jgi:hypothetical protein
MRGEVPPSECHLGGTAAIRRALLGPGTVERHERVSGLKVVLATALLILSATPHGLTNQLDHRRRLSRARWAVQDGHVAGG